MEINDVTTNENGFVIEWSDKNYGFGQLYFNGKVLDSEHMGEEFCKEVFSAFVEKYLKQ